MIITISRKPFKGSLIESVKSTQCGGLSIDESRIGLTGGTSRSHQSEYPKKEDGTEDRSKSWARTGHTVSPLNKGRWPANLFLSKEVSSTLSQENKAHWKSETGGASRFFRVVEE